MNHPSKEQIRQWINQRRTELAPLPDIEQIRHQLGWQRSDKKQEMCADQAELNARCGVAELVN